MDLEQEGDAQVSATRFVWVNWFGTTPVFTAGAGGRGARGGRGRGRGREGAAKAVKREVGSGSEEEGGLEGRWCWGLATDVERNVVARKSRWDEMSSRV